MAIQTLGGIKDVLSQYDSNGWTRSASLEMKSSLDELNPGEFQKEFEKFGALSDAGSTQSFSEMLAGSVTDVNKLQQDANVAIQKLVTGESKNIHETMLAVEKAEIAFKTMNQVRMKVIDAYKEIMRMQV